MKGQLHPGAAIPHRDLHRKIRSYVKEHPGADLEDLYDALDIPLHLLAVAVDYMLCNGQLEEVE